jgi:predicted glycosyltransferase
MRILIYLSHPAQFLFYKNPVKKLRENGNIIFILIKTKDVLGSLLDEAGWEYVNILPEGSGKSKLSAIWSLLNRNLKILRFARQNKVELMMGSDASLAHAGKLLSIPIVTTLEDDYTVIRNLARLTFPFTSHILVPEVCNVGKWDKKKIGYPGYMKLAYLHPYWFKPDPLKAGVNLNTPYFLIRLSGLSAYHDFGIKGINHELLDKIIEKFAKYGRVFISSEKKLASKYQAYMLSIPVSNIHHCLAFASMIICDSQSMAMEAAILGTPGIRISSFSGKISVLEELEHQYGLAHGFQPDEDEYILQRITELLEIPDLRQIYHRRLDKMLADKIDVTSYLVWFIENLPFSVETIKKNPAYVERFL